MKPQVIRPTQPTQSTQIVTRLLMIAFVCAYGAFACQCDPTPSKQEQTIDAAGGQDSTSTDRPGTEPGQEPAITPDRTTPTERRTPPESPDQRAEPLVPDKVPELAPEVRPETAPPDARPFSCRDIPTFETGKAPTKELYVSKSGNNTTGDGSVNKPYATLEKAAAVATPGTRIILRAGQYQGQSISGVRGTAQAPIWITGMIGEPDPVFTGGSEGLHISKSSYLVLKNIEVRNTSANGINCDDGGETTNPMATHHIIFQHIIIDNIGGNGNQDCLKLSGVRNYFVLDSEFSKCGGGGSGSGIDHVGCHDGIIARNTFKDTSGSAVQCKGGSTNIEIRANRIENPGERGINMGGSTGFQFFRPPLSKTSPNAEARNIQVIANLFIGGNTPFAFVGCVLCFATHNTIINPKRWLFRILQETNTKDGYTFEESQQGNLVNNLFYFERKVISTHVNIGANTLPKTFRFAANLWYAHDDPSGSKPTLPNQEQNGIYGQDPQMTAARVYIPKSGSPAEGKGVEHNRPFGDILGKCFRVPPTIGAYEIQP